MSTMKMTSLAAVALVGALALAGCSSTPKTPTPTQSVTAPTGTSISATIPTSTPTPTPAVPTATDPIQGQQRIVLDAGLEVIKNTSGANDDAIGGARDDAQAVFDGTGQEIILLVPLIDPGGTLSYWFGSIRHGYKLDDYGAAVMATMAPTKDAAVAKAQAWIAQQPTPAIWHLEVAEAPVG